MKKNLAITLVLVLTAGACDVWLGPDEALGGEGNLNISFRGTGRAVTSGADLPEDVLAAMRYEISLRGPQGGTH